MRVRGVRLAAHASRSTPWLAQLKPKSLDSTLTFRLSQAAIVARTRFTAFLVLFGASRLFSATPASAQQSCATPSPTSDERREWVSAVQRLAGLPVTPVGSLEIEVAGVPLGTGCATAATLTWDNGFEGGVVVVLPSREIIPAALHMDP